MYVELEGHALSSMFSYGWPATMGLVPFWQPSTLCCSLQFQQLYWL